MASPPRTYSISVLRQALRALTRLPPDVRTRVRRVINGLASEPRPVGCRKLAGSDELYRVRVGDHRVIYAVRDGELVVIVVRVWHRSDVYR